jgi:hypothetical protein
LSKKGKFDEDAFYILEDESFFDPFGFYFNKEGFDEAGGRYDDEGYYVSPFVDEVADIDLDAEYDDEYDPEEFEDPNDALERQAIIQEHVVMAQAYARN